MSEIKTVGKVPSLELRVRTVQPQHPVILEDPGLVWLVRSGTAEVFHSQIEDRFPIGRRRFLFRARPHDALFAMRDAENSSLNRLVMMAVGELTVLEIPLERINEEFL